MTGSSKIFERRNHYDYVYLSDLLRNMSNYISKKILMLRG
ncbi:hypothetical protein FDUTEX481_01292 [Tolypothrix sp. PCC 7601]|nr:hypothetical protein FDUTEX481_01292 [Tolypothrix sp. PCC 7601]